MSIQLAISFPLGSLFKSIIQSLFDLLPDQPYSYTTYLSSSVLALIQHVLFDLHSQQVMSPGTLQYSGNCIGFSSLGYIYSTCTIYIYIRRNQPSTRLYVRRHQPSTQAIYQLVYPFLVYLFTRQHSEPLGLRP